MELILDNIQTPLRNECDFASYRQRIIDILKNDYGWTDTEINQIQDELDKVTETVIQDSNSINNASSEVQPIASESNEQINMLDEIKEDIIRDKLTDNYIQKEDYRNPDNSINYNERVESIIYKEPVVNGISTNPVNIEDAHYTLKQDYPNSYGFRDINGNFFKVNLLTNKIDFVHSSGTLLKIDKNGNITLHCKGSMKQVIEKDYTIQVKGNMDILVNNNKTERIGINSTELIGNEKIEVSANNHKTISSMIDHN